MCTPKVPTLETPQGGVFESNAIARYVARIADKGLFGHTLFEAVRPSPCTACAVIAQSGAEFHAFTAPLLAASS